MSGGSSSLCREIRISAIVTCHNRRELTKLCLTALRKQKRDGCCLDLFLTDDGSTDGTLEMVRDMWPSTTVLSGTGSLYWAAGMALAEQAAIKTSFDYLLWLNDDTVLDDGAITQLLDCSRRNPAAIVVGATRCPVSKATTYGVRRRVDWHPQRFTLIGESAADASGDTFNGNCVLIPATVRAKVGDIDGAFPHAYADDDYGLRASRAGVPVIQAPGTIGTCPANPPSVMQVSGLWRRLRALESPKGLPWKAQVRFLRRHGGKLWPLILLAGYVKRLLKG